MRRIVSQLDGPRITPFGAIGAGARAAARPRSACHAAEGSAMPLAMQEVPRRGAPVPMSEAEWQARVRLAACYRVFDQLGWSETIFNHITLRVPGPQRVLLINPFGLMYHEVTASNLVAVDIDGHPIRPTEHAVNRAGFVAHSAIHGHLQAAHCVMHTHTTTGMAVACQAQGLSHDSFYGAQLSDAVAYHGLGASPSIRTNARACCRAVQARGRAGSWRKEPNFWLFDRRSIFRFLERRRARRGPQRKTPLA
jgi:hypothetical protein